MSWLDNMGRKFLRIRRGLSLYDDLGPVENPERHCHAWAACNYIEAQMSSRDSLHSEFTTNQNPEMAPSPIGFTRELPPEHQPLGAIPRDAHLPDCYRDPSAYWYGLREAHIRNYVAAMAPGLFDLLELPLPHIYVREGHDGHWSCPECGYAIWPFGLGPDEQAVLDAMGAWDEMVAHDEDTGDFHLDTSNPWRFLRYLDVLAWSHMDDHLRAIGMRLSYPDPRDCRPQILSWWLEPEQPSAAAHAPDGSDFPEELYALCDVLRDLDEAGQEYNREWFGIRRLRSASRGIHRASVQLTSLRRKARIRRGELLSDMAQARRGVTNLARALMARRRVDEEELLPWRLELTAHRATAGEVRAWASDWMLEEAVIANM